MLFHIIKRILTLLFTTNNKDKFTFGGNISANFGKTVFVVFFVLESACVIMYSFCMNHVTDICGCLHTLQPFGIHPTTAVLNAPEPG